MNCDHCGCYIPQARVDAGYYLCFGCSELLTVKKHGMVFEDSDGNFQTNIVEGVGRGFATFADSEVELPPTQEL